MVCPLWVDEDCLDVLDLLLGLLLRLFAQVSIHVFPVKIFHTARLHNFRQQSQLLFLVHDLILLLLFGLLYLLFWFSILLLEESGQLALLQVWPLLIWLGLLRSFLFLLLLLLDPGHDDFKYVLALF